MSIFDPKTFSTMTFEGANSTEYVNVPAEEFVGTIDKATVAEWASGDKSKAGLKVTFMWAIDGNERCQDGQTIKELTGRDKALVKQDIMLELSETGALLMGKGQNVQLGLLRDAIGLNAPGMKWTFDSFPGRMARISVKHRADKDDPEKLYAEVKGVTKI